MAKMTLDVVTPNGSIFSDTVDSVVAEGIDGELGILSDHVPFFTALKISVLSYTKDGTKDFVAVMGGLLDVNSNKVTILSPVAEKASDIDVLRAKQEKEKAEEELMRKAADVDFARAEREIIKTVTRIRAVELLDKYGVKRR